MQRLNFFLLFIRLFILVDVIVWLSNRMDVDSNRYIIIIIRWIRTVFQPLNPEILAKLAKCVHCARKICAFVLIWIKRFWYIVGIVIVYVYGECWDDTDIAKAIRFKTSDNRSTKIFSSHIFTFGETTATRLRKFSHFTISHFLQTKHLPHTNTRT